jgi:hypothetical protein
MFFCFVRSDRLISRLVTDPEVREQIIDNHEVRHANEAAFDQVRKYLLSDLRFNTKYRVRRKRRMTRVREGTSFIIIL